MAGASKFRIGFTLALILIATVFAIQNAADVELKFLVWSFSTPRVLLVIALISIGFLIGVLVSTLGGRRR